MFFFNNLREQFVDFLRTQVFAKPKSYQQWLLGGVEDKGFDANQADIEQLIGLGVLHRQDNRLYLSGPASSRAASFERPDLQKLATTEYPNSLTETLSDDLKNPNPETQRKGLQAMLETERNVPTALRQAQGLMSKMTSDMVETLRGGGRIVIVGCGASGRFPYLLAKLFDDMVAKIDGGKYQGRIVPFIPADHHALFVSDDAHEDVIDFGNQIANTLNLNKGTADMVIGISATAGSDLPAGTLKEAAKNARANGHPVRNYFVYNNSNKDVDPWLDKHREDGHDAFKPVLIDSKEPPVMGSTRTLPASADAAALGQCLHDAAATLSQAEAAEASSALADSIDEGIDLLSKADEEILRLVDVFCETLKNPKSPLFLLRETAGPQVGQVTFITEDIPGLVATTEQVAEMTDTFNFPPVVLVDQGKISPPKQTPIMRTFIESQSTNAQVWKDLAGDTVTENTRSLYLGGPDLTQKPEFEGRLGRGNLVVKLFRGDISESDLQKEVLDAKGAKVIRIVLSSTPKPADLPDSVFWFSAPEASTPLSRHIQTKMLLDTVTNAAMAKLGMIEGNIMINFQAANNKLIDRSVRVLETQLKRELPEETAPSYETMLNYVCLITSLYSKMRDPKLVGDEVAYLPPTIDIAKRCLLRGLSIPKAIGEIIS